jgi:hypothetical protein
MRGYNKRPLWRQLFRGRATITPGDDLTTRSWQELMPKGYKARPEQVILFTVSAWDSNCPQHIPAAI